MASYNREQATGDENHNLITAIMLELSLDRSGAMAWAARYHAQVEMRFINGLAQVPSLGTCTDILVKYFDGIANWVRANHCWSYETQRSQPSPSCVNRHLRYLKFQILWYQGRRDTTN
jgi:hypothetical protein